MLYDLTERAFRAAASARGNRVFHPRGVCFRAELDVDPPGDGLGADTELLSRRARHPAIARISRGGGLPEPMPDVLGLAFRLEDPYGPGSRQDFLLATGGRAPVARNLLLPGVQGYGAATYSSLFPHRLGRELRLIGALPTPGRTDLRTLEALERAAPELEFRICAATAAGPWQQFGTLTLGSQLPSRECEELDLDPWNTGGGIRPVGPLMGLRRPAYAGSRAGRRLASGG